MQYQLDPHIVSAITANTLRAIYQGLLAFDLRTYEPIAELAQKWEQPSQTEYIFTLQPGVKWQNKPPANGRELTIDDVLYSLKRVSSDEPQFVSRSALEAVAKMEAVSSSSIKITAKEPNVTVLSKFSGDPIMILNPETVEKADKFLDPQEAVGTGPFMITAREERVSAEFERNPNYWKPGLPYLDGLRTAYFNEQQHAYAAWIGGQLDISGLPVEHQKDYIARRGSGFVPDRFKSTTISPAEINVQRKPLDDARVWRALRLLIDHNEWRRRDEKLTGEVGRYASVFPAALEQWDIAEAEYEKKVFWKQPKDDAAREALELLSAAGFTKDNPLRFELTVQEGFIDDAELLDGQWRRLGQGVVDTQLKQVDRATATKVRSQKAFEAIFHGQVVSQTEPDAWLSELYRTGGSRNFGGFSDPKLDEMIDKQRVMFNTEERKAFVKQIVDYAADHVATVSPASAVGGLLAVKPTVRDHIPESTIFAGRQCEWLWLES